MTAITWRYCVQTFRQSVARLSKLITRWKCRKLQCWTHIYRPTTLHITLLAYIYSHALVINEWLLYALHRCGDLYVGEYCEYSNPCVTYQCNNGGQCQVLMSITAVSATCSCPLGKRTFISYLFKHTACAGEHVAGSSCVRNEVNAVMLIIGII